MAAYIDIEKAKTVDGLRLVLPPGRPNPWGEALKGFCYLKKIPYVRVGKGQGHDPALQAWTSQSSAPVAVWNDERPRSTWIEQLHLVERLAPQPPLIPELIDDRALMFGYCNELCGENGFGWLRRVMTLHKTLSNTESDEAARAFASYMGGKYGYSTEVAGAAPQQVAHILHQLNAQLASQQAKGRKFFIGDHLSALDIYWSTFAVMIKPLPPEQCAIPDAFRAFLTNTDPVVAAAATPQLMAHREFIYHTYLELPLDL